MLFLLRLNVSKKSESSPSCERRHVAADVAARGRVLDLDHLGAEVGELERAPRARRRTARSRARGRQRAAARATSASRSASSNSREVEDDVLGARVDVLADARGALVRRAGDAVAVDDVLGEVARVARAQVLVRASRFSPTCAGQGDRAATTRSGSCASASREASRPRPRSGSSRRRASPRGGSPPPSGRRPRAAGRPAAPAAARSGSRRRRRTGPAKLAGASAEELPQRAHRLVRARAALAHGRRRPPRSPSRPRRRRRRRGSRGRRRRSRARRTPWRRRSGGAAAGARSPAPSVIRSVTAAKVESATTTSRSGFAVRDVVAGPDRVVAELLGRLRRARGRRPGPGTPPTCWPLPWMPNETARSTRRPAAPGLLVVRAQELEVRRASRRRPRRRRRASIAAAIARCCSLIARWNARPEPRPREVPSGGRRRSAGPRSRAACSRSRRSRRGGSPGCRRTARCVPRRSGSSGIDSRSRSSSSSVRRRAASRAAGTSSSSRASSSSSSVTSSASVSSVDARVERSRRRRRRSAASRTSRRRRPSPCGSGSARRASRSASRTVARLTPNSWASTVSFGSRRPGAKLALDDLLAQPLGDSLVLLRRRSSVDPELAVPGHGARAPDDGRQVAVGEVLRQRVPVRRATAARCRSASVAASSISSVRSSAKTTP